MLWVCRTGKKGEFEELCVKNSCVILPWLGYKQNLLELKERRELKDLVRKEKNTDNPTSISNWAGQLYSFVYEMQVGDYVLIPSKSSRWFTLAEITGNYKFNEVDNSGLFHSRNIRIIKAKIPRDIFPQEIVYSLGAFRTLFKAKNEKMIFECIDKKTKTVCGEVDR